MTQTNKQKITSITFKPKAYCYCPLGDDWYTNELEIYIGVGDLFPDYCDIEKYLNGEIRGKSLIIEDVIAKVYEYIETTYKPLYLSVSSHIQDAISHSEVYVTKES